MKKLFCILLAIVMALSISACNSNGIAGKNAGNNTEPPAELPSAEPTIEQTHEATPIPTPTPQPTAIPTNELTPIPTPEPTTESTPVTTPEQTTPAVENTESVFNGSIVDGVYTNEFIGISIEVPSGWTILSREQLLSMMGIAASYIDLPEEQLIAELENTENIIDLVASSVMGSSIQVQLINLRANHGMLSMTADEIIDTALDEIERIFDENGLSVQLGGKVNCELVGNAYISVDIEMEFMGISIVQRCLFRMVGDYMVQIAFTVSELDTGVTIDQLQALIRPFNNTI